MVLIGVVGPKFSGVSTFVNHLIETQGFTLLEIASSSTSSEKQVDSRMKFESFSDAIQFATSHWREQFLIRDLHKYSDFEIAFKRPFFVLVCIQSPVTTRFHRRNLAHGNDDLTLSDLSLNDPRQVQDEKGVDHFHSPTLSLESFLALDEQDLYSIHPEQQNLEYSLYDFIRKAYITIFNNGTCLNKFKQEIDSLNLVDPEHTRPSWDSYFMALCELASKRSNCMKRRVGCILVSENRVISTGYNGTPRNVLNCNEGGCARCNGNAKCGSSLDNCICMHAEENALLEAGRERITNRNVTLYCNTCPCLGCAKKIVQVGIKEVVYAQDYGMDSMTRDLLNAAGVILRQTLPLTVQIAQGAMHSLH